MPRPLWDSAIELRDLLQSYSNREPAAQLCLQGLGSLLDQAIAGAISKPHRSPAPCGYYFVEGRLPEYRDLAEEYAAFSMRLQGVSHEDLTRMLEQIRRKPASK